MLITQKYNSVKDIDPEFIAPLEELLANCIPNFEIIKNHEEQTSDNINFAYYLFFGEHTNAPIGFAQIEIKNEKEVTKSFFKKITTKNSSPPLYKKSVKWKIPGSLKEGVIFKPRYIKYANTQIQEIFTQLFDRDDIISQELRYSQEYLEAQDFKELSRLKHTTSYITDTLIKNQEDYQAFFMTLSEDMNLHIKRQWREISNALNFKLGEYKYFKEIFEYKSQGASQYKKLKSNSQIKKYLTSEYPIFFLTLETPEEIKALIVYTIGKSGNSFYEIILESEHISKVLIHQIAIMKFYESNESNRLHFLGETGGLTHRLLELGYSKKEQVILCISREDYDSL